MTFYLLLATFACYQYIYLNIIAGNFVEHTTIALYGIEVDHVTVNNITAEPSGFLFKKDFTDFNNYPNWLLDSSFFTDLYSLNFLVRFVAISKAS